jgi:hypothetical protein
MLSLQITGVRFRDADGNRPAFNERRAALSVSVFIYCFRGLAKQDLFILF